MAGRFPGLLTWLYDHSSNLGMQNLRQNKDQGRIVAQKLLDSKRQELKDGTAKKDVMSSLGLSLPHLLLLAWSLRTSQSQSSPVILSAKTGD